MSQSQPGNSSRSGASGSAVDPLAAYKKPKEMRERWEYVEGKWVSKLTEDWE